jgi:RimJ/RimL family protein N-acetyltransferase
MKDAIKSVTSSFSRNFSIMIFGNALFLKSANLADRRKMYHWLTCSDIPPEKPDTPAFPEAPAPSWEEFCADYTDSYFGNSSMQGSKLFLIMMEGEEIGVVGYDLLDPKAGHVVLNIWLRAKKFSDHGPDALEILCEYLHKKYGISEFFMRPSAGNAKTWAAYEKCGCKILPMSRDEFRTRFGGAREFEYADNVKFYKNIAKAVAVELVS